MSGQMNIRIDEELKQKFQGLAQQEGKSAFFVRGDDDLLALGRYGIVSIQIPDEFLDAFSG